MADVDITINMNPTQSAFGVSRAREVALFAPRGEGKQPGRYAGHGPDRARSLG